MTYAVDASPPFYHGTRADLGVGDLLAPGFDSHYGERKLSWIYFSGTLDAAIWGCELARGDGRERIYIVEPTGAFFDDPNITDKRFPGNADVRGSLPLSRRILPPSVHGRRLSDIDPQGGHPGDRDGQKPAGRMGVPVATKGRLGKLTTNLIVVTLGGAAYVEEHQRFPRGPFRGLHQEAD
jgi:hypothetical protein